MPKPTKNPGLLTFEAVLRASDAPNSSFIVFPYDLKETFGIGNLVPVKVTYDGIPYRGSIAKMGPEPMLLIKKEINEKLGKERGNTVLVTVMLDTEPRTVEVPDDLYKALVANNLLEYFNGLAYTHRKEYVTWIESAKQQKTRNRRLEKAVEMMKEKLHQ